MMHNTLSDHYTAYAWANGDTALIAGRWPYIQRQLNNWEPDHPGLTAEVMARLARLRKEHAHER